MDPITKSANALDFIYEMPAAREGIHQDTHRSGETLLNRARFSGLTCVLNDAVSTNWPTLLENLYIAIA